MGLLGDAIGTAVWLVLPGRRAITASNLRFVFGGERDSWGIAVLTRRHFWHLGNQLLEIFMLPALADSRLRRARIRFRGLEHFHRLASEGQAALLVTAHHGNWDLILNVAREGVPFKALYKPSKAWIDRILGFCRSSSGVTMLDNKKPSDLRSMIRGLRKKGVQGVVGDQGGSRGWVRHPFFGGLSSFPVGLTELALKYDAAIVPVWGVRQRDRSLLVEADAPLPMPRTGTEEERALALRDAYVRRLEERIRRSPEQYYWVHDVWRHFKDIPHPDWEVDRVRP